MSDEYNTNDGNFDQPSENYSYYSNNYSDNFDTPLQMPKKPKNHTGIKVVAVILTVAVGCAGGLQLMKFLGNDDIRFTDETQNSASEITESNNRDITESDAVSSNAPEPQNLPGLFDIASRTDAKYLPDIVDEIMPSVVGISSTFEIEYKMNNSFSPWGWGFQSEPVTREGISTGTGIVMSEDGYIVTNAHVVYMEETDEYYASESSEVSILFNDENEYEAKIVAYDVETDLAVLKIDETGFTPATFGNSDELRVGELVIAVGNPLGFELFGSVTSGIVSALNREITINDKNMTLIQTDAAINAGNSGGPLLNSCGQVIGINSAKMSSSYGSASIEGLGFAIPINDAKPIIDDLINNKYVTGRPQIGISTVNINAAYSSYLGLPMGIYVRAVAEGSSAEKAGISVGDVIIGINDEAVKTDDELNAIKNKFKAGDTITLKIYRNGQDIDVALELQEARNDMTGIPEETEEPTNDPESLIQPR